MILLDTNIVSEVYRPRPDPSVIAWLDSQPLEDLYLSTPVLAEMHYGLSLLEPSARKDRLQRSLDRLENEVYRDRILVFEKAAAIEYGRIAALRHRAGRSLGKLDGLIAAIALTHGAAVATRDVRDFSGLGLEVINPFESSAD